MTNKEGMNRPLALLIIMLLGITAFAQDDTRSLVSQMVNNELAVQKQEHYWIYLDSNTNTKKQTEVKRVLQTKECWLSWPVSMNGHAPSESEKKQASQKIDKLVNDPEVRAKNRKEIDEDSAKADGLLKILPDAFLFTKAAQNKTSITFRFQPNPKYNPTSNEAKVFHNMAGVLVMSSREKRLQKLSGKLVNDVDFGLGILGKIRKGGTFTVVQSEVAPRDWELTLLDVHINGRALFFHSISEQQRETMTQFKAVPAGINLQQAAKLVEEPAR